MLEQKSPSPVKPLNNKLADNEFFVHKKIPLIQKSNKLLTSVSILIFNLIFVFCNLEVRIGQEV